MIKACLLFNNLMPGKSIKMSAVFYLERYNAEITASAAAAAAAAHFNIFPGMFEDAETVYSSLGIA